MPCNVLKYYPNEASARSLFEALRWPDGPRCPHCSSGCFVRLTGKATRSGLYGCRQCRGSYTVTVGTLLHRTRVPLSRWLLLVELLCSSRGKTGILNLADNLGVNYRTVRKMVEIAGPAIECSDLSAEVVISRLLGEPRRRVELCIVRRRWNRRNGFSGL